MAERKFVGNGKEIGQYGNIAIGLQYADLKPGPSGWVNLIVGKMKQPNDKGKTHTVWLDDWQPKNRANGVAPASAHPGGQASQQSANVPDDLPF